MDGGLRYATNKMNLNITYGEYSQIAEILNRRSNEIAMFSCDYRSETNTRGGVELALSREIDRLRRLSDKICPPSEDE